MNSVRDSIKKGVASAAQRGGAANEPPTSLTLYELYQIKEVLEHYFRQEPEAIRAHILDTYSKTAVKSYGGRREFADDWLDKNGFSEADVAEMRRRIGPRRPDATVVKHHLVK